MVTIQLKPSCHPLAEYIYRLEQGKALLKNSPNNVLEVVGILKSYGMILDAYSRNLIYIAENQFLRIFPFLNILMVRFPSKNYWTIGVMTVLILSMLNIV